MVVYPTPHSSFPVGLQTALRSMVQQKVLAQACVNTDLSNKANSEAHL
jgi:hypothetical protein